MAINLPTNMLRSFVAIVETGSMLGATEQVFVSQSALSLQVKRLEELVQQPLFLREGRRLALTGAGEMLLDYARRLLALHDEALARIGAGGFEGPMRIGMVQDFADLLLSGVLARFAELNADAQIFARVAGTAELLDLLDKGQLDLAIGYGAPGDERTVRTASTRWFGDEALASKAVLPLAVLEKPCRFREASITALEGAGRPWRIAIETPNLSTLRAAVVSGLGVASRTGLFLHDLPALPQGLLPDLPDVACLVVAAHHDGAIGSLAQLATDAIRNL